MKNKILKNTLAALKQQYEAKLLEAAETFENGTLLKLEIEIDEFPSNPRDDTNLGTIICTHKRYNLGDQLPFSIKDCESWEGAREKIKSQHAGKELLILPVYMMDHGGLSLSTKPFDCPWDSGQIGFIYAKKGEEGLTDQELQNSLESEIKSYSKYIEGEVYEWRIINTISGECLDSCGGFLRHSEAQKDGEAALKSFID
jgi:hypothetical protein